MPNQVESYQKVIEVIADVNFDHDARAILVQIAKTSPQVVVDAFEYLKGAPINRYGVSQAVMDELKGGRKIQAIKQHRLETGLGLKDAKDAVEAVIDLNPTLREVFCRSY